MRPLFLLLGVWHSIVSVLIGLYGGWLLLSSLFRWGFGAVEGGLFLACGIIALPALGVIAQGSKGVRSAGAALALPGFILTLRAMEWGFWMPQLWLYVVPFLPGVALGVWAMTRQEKAI